MYVYLTSGVHASEDEIERLIDDPDEFEKTVEYGLFIENQKWYIKELKRGIFYPKKLMIDQDGKIHEKEWVN